MGRYCLYLLAVIVFGAACRSKPAAPAANGSNGNNGNSRPELFIAPVKTQTYGPNGLEWTLEAPRAKAYTTKNIMKAENLTVTLFENGQKSTRITANEGILNTKHAPPPAEGQPNDEAIEELYAGDMFLRGNVVVVSTDGSKMTTEWLRFNKKIDLITSTAPVKIVREDSITEGVGMEAKPDLSSVKIFNQNLRIKGKPKTKS
jgi:lipopolysaccharide export system protein LptC